jgi:hypothetical protein
MNMLAVAMHSFRLSLFCIPLMLSCERINRAIGTWWKRNGGKMIFSVQRAHAGRRVFGVITLCLIFAASLLLFVEHVIASTVVGPIDTPSGTGTYIAGFLQIIAQLSLLITPAMGALFAFIQRGAIWEIISDVHQILPHAQIVYDMPADASSTQRIPLKTSTHPVVFGLLIFGEIFLSGYVFISFILAAVSIPAVFLSFVSILSWSPIPSAFGPVHLSWLDWYSVIYPAILALVLLYSMVAISVMTRRSAIVLEKHGVVVRDITHRKRFIPWGDLRRIIHLSEKQGYRGHYILVTNDTFIFFAVGSKPFISTLVLRAGLPVEVFSGPWNRTWLFRQKSPSWNRDGAVTAPIADATLQPPALIGSVSDTVRLASPIPPWRPLVYGIGYGSIFIIIFVGSMILFGNVLSLVSRDSSLVPYFVGTIVCICILCIGASVAMLYQTRQQRFPTLTADAAGIHHGKKVIAWNDIRAWGIQSPCRQRTRFDHYQIFADEGKGLFIGGSLFWAVKKDDESRQRAAQFHAMIAARTGLPMRDFSDGAPEVHG